MSRFQQRLSGRRSSVPIDLTPLIDAMVVLVILLALESSFGLVTDPGRLHVGDGERFQFDAASDVMISFDNEGDVMLVDQTVTVDQLAAAVSALVEKTEARFVLAGDDDAAYGAFLEIEDILRGAGVESYQRIQKREE